MITIDAHIGWLVLGGVALLAMTLLPQRFAERPLSLPIVYVAGGFVAFSAIGGLGGGLDPVGSDFDSRIVEYATELIVIMSLAAAGLKLDRAVGWVSWSAVWRLLSVTMVLTVATAVAVGMTWLGLSAAAAVLLGAAVAPTDPVLADDVQVDEPGDDLENEVRFTLTAEAGLNDGLAFPISWLAVALTADGFGSVVGNWLAVDVVVRIAIGLAAGVVLGRLLVVLSRWVSDDDSTVTSSGVFVLGATIVVYGVTEAINGYGFLAVFVAALSRDVDDVNVRLARFADELERMLLAFVLLGFGSLLAAGVLDALTWQGAAVAVGLVMIVRPVAGWLGLLGSRLTRGERGAIAFFGIRGMGSLFYLSWAVNEADFAPEEVAVVWAVVGATVLTSVIVHGVAATPVMRRVEASRG